MKPAARWKKNAVLLKSVKRLHVVQLKKLLLPRPQQHRLPWLNKSRSLLLHALPLHHRQPARTLVRKAHALFLQMKNQLRMLQHVSVVQTPATMMIVECAVVRVCLSVARLPRRFPPSLLHV